MNNQVRALTFGAMITSLYLTFLLVSQFFFFGLLESQFFFLIPLPFIVYCLKYRLKFTKAVFLSVIISAFLINPLSTLIFILPSLAYAWVYSSLLRRYSSDRDLILFSLCFGIVNQFTVLIIGSLILNINILEDTISFLEIFGIDKKYAPQLLIPVTIILGSLSGAINCLYSKIILKKLKLYPLSKRNVV